MVLGEKFPAKNLITCTFYVENCKLRAFELWSYDNLMNFKRNIKTRTFERYTCGLEHWSCKSYNKLVHQHSAMKAL